MGLHGDLQGDLPFLVAGRFAFGRFFREICIFWSVLQGDLPLFGWVYKEVYREIVPFWFGLQGDLLQGDLPFLVGFTGRFAPCLVGRFTPFWLGLQGDLPLFGWVYNFLVGCTGRFAPF